MLLQHQLVYRVATLSHWASIATPTIHLRILDPILVAVQVGVRQVIQGWDQGILGNDSIPPMKVHPAPRPSRGLLTA